MVNITEEYLYQLYWSNKLSTVDIGRIYKCTEANIRYYMRKFNISFRTPSEKLKLFYSKNICKVTITPNLRWNKNMCYILGVTYGDGWVYRKRYNYMVGLGVVNKEFAISFMKSLNKIGLHPSMSVKIPKNNRHSKQFHIIANSRLFYEWYTGLTFRTVRAKLLNNKKFMVAFLRGFYESEGTIEHRSRNNYRITIYNTNNNLVELVECCLNNLNFKFSEYITTHKGRKNKPLYHIGILGGNKETTRFLSLIKPCIKGGD